MKTCCCTHHRFAFLRLASVVLALAVGAVTQTSGQVPVGSWDFVLSGSEHGVAQVTFLADGQLTGQVALTFFGSGAARTNGAAVIRPIYGAASLDGTWIYESSNRIAGVLNEISGQSTNLATNGLSFRGVVKPARMHLLAFGSQGRVSFRGVPLVGTNDLTGTYQGSGRKPRVSFPFIEVLDLAAVGPNNYGVTGRGAGYNSTGTFLVSRQKYAALFQTPGSPTDGSVSAYAGPFNFNKRRGSFRGTDGTTPGIHYKMFPEAP